MAEVVAASGALIVLALAGATARQAGGGVSAGGLTSSAGAILVTHTPSDSPSARHDLYVVRTDGSRPRVFVRDAADADISRDGRQIAFVRGGAIWVMKNNGVEQRQLTHPARSFADDTPAWAPDGKSLYFSRGTGYPRLVMGAHTASLYAIRADGTGLQRLTRASRSGGMGDEPACHYRPSPSPDGRVIVFTNVFSCDHGLGSRITAVTTAGKPVKLPSSLPNSVCCEEQYIDAAVSPRGGKIAYAIWNDIVGPKTFNVIDVSDLSGRVTRILAFAWAPPDGPVDLSWPAWSADGTWLAFIRARTSHGWVPLSWQSAGARPGDIWLARSDGRGLRRLTHQGTYTAPAWLPPPTGGAGGLVQARRGF
jgi:Tol biopolymer transport system component